MLLSRTIEHVRVVGHRIVHGGARFTAAVAVDDAVRAALEELVALAPLHQPPALAALESRAAASPERLHVACFDTAFHAALPDGAATYAVPADWRARLARATLRLPRAVARLRRPPRRSDART